MYAGKRILCFHAPGHASIGQKTGPVFRKYLEMFPETTEICRKIPGVISDTFPRTGFLRDSNALNF